MGVICARNGIDLAQACRQRASGSSQLDGAAPGATGALIPADGSDYAESFMDVDVRDCEVLQKVVNPLCSFAPPGDSAKGLHSKVRLGKGYTIEFWIKIDRKTRIPRSNDDYKAEATSMRRIVFFSRVSPPRALASITLRTNFDDLEFQAFGNCRAYNKAKVASSFPKAVALKAESWVKIAIEYGARNDHDKMGVRIFQVS